MILRHFFDFVLRAEDDAHTLVQLRGLDVEDALLAVGGGAAGLLVIDLFPVKTLKK
jgi:hypothetical protein